MKNTDAVSNFLWISDTISKYNRCVTAKDAVTEAYSGQDVPVASVKWTAQSGGQQQKPTEASEQNIAQPQ